MKQDLRFEKTEKALQQAFLELLQTTEMAKISVTDICRLANVSRNAFYQHYEGKEHLYDNMLNHILIAIEKACTPLVSHISDITERESRLFLNNILEAVEQNRYVIYHLLVSQPATFSLAFHKMLVAANTASSHQTATAPNIPYITVFSGGVVAFITHWLLETNLSLEEAQDTLFNILGQLNMTDCNT